ncbi:BA14K family protein [Aestuariivirga litoralis]|uniref:BA14K family protein n=1 Tax=Aestuariivirga litoralis TaxID=2650924 RepID=UPI0018C5F894|nr:BA14K family protein [Aestuariivirga litoralis]MBG1231883.1 BA14K family protein [Aestuariivirga litoralis]
MKRFLVVCVSLAALAAPAYADRQAYCQAYARDFADQAATDQATWDHKFQISLASCLQPKAVKAEAPPPVPKPKAVEAKAVPVKAPAPPAQETAAPQDNATAEPAAPKSASEKPLPGTEAFNDYCAKKYTSFDPKTGKYLSHNGVKRPCLVTKDFKG